MGFTNGKAWGKHYHGSTYTEIMRHREFFCLLLRTGTWILHLQVGTNSWKLAKRQNNKAPKKGGEKGTRWMDPSLGKINKPPSRANRKGNMNKLSTQTPFSLVARSISNKERGETLEKTLTLEEPSHIRTSHLEIKSTCICYNVTNTLCL